MVNISRKTDIMGDAAKHIFLSDPSVCNGKNFIDDEVLASVDVDVEQYRVNQNIHEKDLMPDFLLILITYKNKNLLFNIKKILKIYLRKWEL